MEAYRQLVGGRKRWKWRAAPDEDENYEIIITL